MAEKDALFEKLRQIGKSLGKEDVTDALAQILQQESKNGGNLHQVLTEVGRIGVGIGGMFSPNYMTKWSGLMSVVSGIRGLVPIFGPQAKEFAKFVTSVLVWSKRDCIASSPGSIQNKNTITMFAETITGALDMFEDTGIKTNAASTCRVLAFAHNILIGANNDSDKCPGRSEISNILRMIDINAGVKTLGLIESRIFSLMASHQETLSEEALSTYSRRVIQYIDMYCQLAILRDAVMLELYALLTCSGHGDRLVEGLKTALEGEHERDRNLVKSLVLPHQNQIRFAAFFDPENWPFTCEFMCINNIQAVASLDKIPVVMNTMKWMDWFVIHDTKPAVCLRALKFPKDKSLDKTKHNLLFIKKEGSTCYYISPQGKRGHYVVMEGGDKKWVEVKPGKPGKEGEWNVFTVQDIDAVYVLSTRRWPLHFLSMSDTWSGWLQGRILSVSDPSAHWNIQYNGSRA